jgi:hypothetical protein
MKKLITVGILFIAVTLNAQTAKVIELSADDAKEAKALHEAQLDLDSKVLALHTRILADYLTDKSGGKLRNPWVGNYSGNVTWLTNGDVYKVGWSGEFEYSDDFRFIVPKTYISQGIKAATCSNLPGWYVNNIQPAKYPDGSPIMIQHLRNEDGYIPGSDH